MQFYDHLIDVLRKEGLAYEDKIIIGGDFNCPINPLLGEEFSDVRVAWDWIKYNVRLFTINYSKEVAKTKKGERRKVAKKIANCSSTVSADPL